MVQAILDASIAAPWFLPDEASDTSDRVYASVRRGTIALHAPELWLWECGNIVASAVKRRRLSVDDASIAWGAVGAIRTRVELAPATKEEVDAALQVAFALKLSIYDAAYLRLAETMALPLLTADQALRRAALARGVPTLAMRDIA